MKKYKSLYQFSEDIQLLIEINKLDKALVLISNFVEDIFAQPLCVSNGDGSKYLDDLCQQIGKKTLNNIEMGYKPKYWTENESVTVVYVVTKLQMSGGHTRIIQDLISAEPEKKHIILSTELCGKSDVDYIKKYCIDKQNVEYKLCTERRYLNTLVWLQSCILDIKPSKLFLLNHHQDSVAVAAIQPQMDLNSSFCHHGDHQLSLGVYLSHMTHIDLHPAGYQYCREFLGLSNYYLPLVVEDHGDRPKGIGFIKDGVFKTCTAARSNKIDPPYFIDYCDVIPQLLKKTNGKHLHIGRLSPWTLLKIRWKMLKNGVAPSKFIYISWVPSVWKTLQEYKVDLYVTSFPYGGILTLIEAMGSGTPVVIHKHLFSRVLSGIDIADSGFFSWRYPNDLFNFCENLTNKELSLMSARGRKQYEEFHSTNCLREHLHDADKNSVRFFIIPKYDKQNDEWIFWIRNHFRLRNLILNYLKYKIKKLGKFIYEISL